MENNRKNAILIINNKKYKNKGKCILKEFININEIKEDKLKIYLILKKLSNISHMFKNCTKLIEFSKCDNIINIEDNEEERFESKEYFDFSNNNENTNDDSQRTLCEDFGIDSAFRNYSEITENIESYENNSSIRTFTKDELQIYKHNFYFDIGGIFYNCLLLSTLSGISEWNTDYTNNMSNIFYNCISLPSLPDISKWNTDNAINMNNMFYNCRLLLSPLPDISKWNTQNVYNLNSMFFDCNSLSSLPYISKWNTQNVRDMSKLLLNCKSLLSLPDISKWNTNNVTDMSNLFISCESLTLLPDISNWNTDNVTDMSEMFSNCLSLESLPNISKSK